MVGRAVGFGEGTFLDRGFSRDACGWKLEASPGEEHFAERMMEPPGRVDCREREPCNADPPQAA